MTQHHEPSGPHLTLGRRDVLRAAAASITAPLAISALSLQAAASYGGSDTLRVGLIGCGGRGTGAAVQALRADKGAVLVAMGDIFSDRLESSLNGITEAMGEEAAKRVDVPAERRFVGFDAYQKVIDAGVDVVILTTTPNFRPLHARAAVEAGKHVFAEKPVAVDAAGVRSFMETAAMAKARSLALQVGFCWRYSDAERATFQRVNEGAIGDIVTVHTTYHTSTLSRRPRQPEWSDVEFQMRNWWHFTWISGDHIVEQAVHSIDKLLWATGDRLPVRCNALGGRAARSGPEHGYVFDNFSVIYEYDNGTRCFHTCRQIDGCPSDNTDYIYGTLGSAVVNGWIPRHTVSRSGGTEWKYDGPRRDMYQNEHDALFKSIRDGAPINDGERGAHSTLMAIMGRMAAYTGQTVSWDQAMKSKEDLTPPNLAFGSLPVPPVPVPGKSKLV